MYKDFINFTLMGVLVLLISCSKDDNSQIVFRDITAKTVSPVSCNIYVYQIEIDLQEGKKWVGIIDLPEKYRRPDLQIILNLAEYDLSKLACVTLSPNEFYYARNVRLSQE